MAWHNGFQHGRRHRSSRARSVSTSSYSESYSDVEAPSSTRWRRANPITPHNVQLAGRVMLASPSPRCQCCKTFNWPAFLCLAAVGLAVALLLAVMAGCLLWYKGFVPRTRWNANAVETTCTTVQTQVPSHMCSESCDCTTESCGDGCSTQICQTCDYECWNVNVVFFYDTADGQRIGNTTTVDTDDRVQATANAVAAQYPDNGTFKCYYQQTDVHDWRQAKYPDTELSGYIGGTASVVAIGCAAFLVLLFVGVYCGCKRE